MKREEAGRKGAEARWGREESSSNRGSNNQQRPMSREDAGRKGAEARWGRDYEREEDYSYQRPLEKEYNNVKRSTAKDPSERVLLWDVDEEAESFLIGRGGHYPEGTVYDQDQDEGEEEDFDKEEDYSEPYNDENQFHHHSSRRGPNLR